MDFNATILTEPMGKERPRAAIRDGRPVIYTPNRTVEAQMRIRTAVHKTRIFYPAGTPLHMELDFYLRRPKSVKRKWPTVKPDVSNCVKLAEDALEGFLFDNDSQVVSLRAAKHYAAQGELPRIEIRVKEIGEK